MAQTIRDKAVVIRISDYKDYDRILRVFTLSGGIMPVLIKGVKRAGAKLKHIAQPFCIFEGEFIKRGEFYTLINAEALENTFPLCANPSSYAVACLMCEAIEKALGTLTSAEVFLSLLSAFKHLLYHENHVYTGCVFMLELLKAAGLLPQMDYYPQPQTVSQLCGYIQKNGYDGFDNEPLALKCLKAICKSFCKNLNCILLSLKFFDNL